MKILNALRNFAGAAQSWLMRKLAKFKQDLLNPEVDILAGAITAVAAGQALIFGALAAVFVWNGLWISALILIGFLLLTGWTYYHNIKALTELIRYRLLTLFAEAAASDFTPDFNVA